MSAAAASAGPRDPEANPFATARICPGAIAYRFPSGIDAAMLIDRLRANQWFGEILGPHGSGKSTLLATLIEALQRAPSALPATAAIQNRKSKIQNHSGSATSAILFVELHDGQRRLPIDLRSDPRLRPPALLIIDGYEQLPRWRRWRIETFCRRRGLGLLVTAHQSVGLPLLFQTSVDVETTAEIIRALLGDQTDRLPQATENLPARIARHDGNLREVLFELYDEFERG